MVRRQRENKNMNSIKGKRWETQICAHQFIEPLRHGEYPSHCFFYICKMRNVKRSITASINGTVDEFPG
jgi:hypothetical protein